MEGQGQVQVAIFESEPLARLAEERLRAEGIPCLVRPVGVGPGGWGTAANLPHALLVPASEEGRARQVLDLPPEEVEERPRPLAVRSTSRLVALLLLILAAALLLGLVDRLFARLFP